MFLRTRNTLSLTVGLLSIVAPVFGTALTVSNSDTETLFSNGTPAFRVDVGPGNNGGLQSAVWLTPNTFSANYTFVLPYLVPAGNSINSAVLDLSSITSLLALNITPEANFHAGNNKQKTPLFNLSYQPLFAPSSSSLYATITAGSVSTLVNVQSLPGYDLIANGFGGELANGTPLTIAWQQSLALSASTSNFSPNVNQWSNAYRDYFVSGNVQSTATAQLTLDYSPDGTTVPEPGTWALIGLGGVFIGLLKRRIG
jgi:hypothetical protein